MTDSDVQTWIPVPGFTIRYQVTPHPVRDDGAQIRNRNGQLIKPRSNDGEHPERGYLIVTLTDDNGEKQTVTVHSLVLTAFEGPRPPGAEACHGPGGHQDNRWPENIRWDTRDVNVAEQVANRPPKPPKTPAACIRCGEPVTKGGRRCHACVVEIGMEAARMMREGARLGEANDRLEYGNAEYLHVLAVKYGGWGHCPQCSCSQSVKVTLRDKLRRANRAWRGDGQ